MTVNNFTNIKIGKLIPIKICGKNKYNTNLWECNRGGNGYDVDKCSCGFEIKKSKGLSCFLGDLLETIDKTSLRKLK